MTKPIKRKTNALQLKISKGNGSHTIAILACKDIKMARRELNKLGDKGQIVSGVCPQGSCPRIVRSYQAVPGKMPLVL